ncbi:hypothetical protein M569_07315, partial [Genlisea aurea]
SGSMKTVPSLCSSSETLMAYSTLFRDQHHSLLASENPGTLLPHLIKSGGNDLKMEKEVLHMNSHYTANFSHQGVQDKSPEKIDVDDDPDLCILEAMSTPVPHNRLSMDAKLNASLKTLSDLDVKRSATYSRHKQNDERTIFQVAMEDLSKPRSEASPPDGVLSVPLLKHQRIALSWMVSKETKGACCSGGILADDQGLGKTISTIALILKERSPSSKMARTAEWQSKAEMLNLDEDDDMSLQASHVTGGTQPYNFSGRPVYADVSSQSKGRPSGGTLIVCPTSVLRQWSDELQNKVTSEASLSVLVYYGNNRTKDPCVLASYDVVITTYSIVSMEVPKQPVVGDSDSYSGSMHNAISSCSKRKSHEMLKKPRKGLDDELIENISGPLAKVGWFRVVLDEAQSIKNHRTQVSRACCGLRAKRRWCLSGTPIQNAIDDLYSYFRFLRHEPYATFRTFAEQLKVPIHKNPRTGYKKLQAVLRTIMLRRTK